MTVIPMLENYRGAVGGGHSSARVSEAFQRGFMPGVASFFETCQLHAMVAMNELHVDHMNLPAYAALFAIANPVVAGLISNPHTLPLGLAAANSPVLAAGWVGSSTPDTSGGFTPEAAAAAKRDHGIDVGGNSQAANIRSLNARASDDAHKR